MGYSVNATWTALFSLAFLWFIASGALHVLASIGTSLLWLLVTSILWVVAAALFMEEIKDWECDGTPIVSVCVPFNGFGCGLNLTCTNAAVAEWLLQSWQ